MKYASPGQRGFQVIKLLIAGSILLILTALMIPNIGRFMGGGESDIRKVEKNNIQSSVTGMMQDNNLSILPNPVDDPTLASNDMSRFPDFKSSWTNSPGGKFKDPRGEPYTDGDKEGYVLYAHDKTGNGDTTVLVDYVHITRSRYSYTADPDGTVHQYDSPGGAEFID
ncbi:MAG: type II secretion system protein [Dehalococcoidia bacterium]|nr:type II secretion system protein [Dehalococcoidia bacterium]